LEPRTDAKDDDEAEQPLDSIQDLRPVALSDTQTSIVERLDAIVQVRPDALAADVAGATLTWSELDQRSNALALQLHTELGPGPEPVAIVGISGPDMLIAPMAILKSGRPYTWVDTTLPPSRAMQVVSLSQAKSAIVGGLSPELSDALAGAGLSLRQVGVDRAADRPKISIGPADPASIVFTSGSTGTPKGVVTPHRYHLFHAATCAERGFSSEDRVALVIPISFAYGAIVFWRTVLVGATVLPYDPRELGIESFAQWCSEQHITVLESTPSFFRSLARSATGVLDSLRIVESAGEPLFMRDAIEIRQHFSSKCIFRNSIGCSETGAYGFFAINPLDHEVEGIVPVGTGTPYKEITICDFEDNPVPSGSTGEIIVTSHFNANGYWNQPDLTATRFTANPDGRTSYHTGDLGRLLPDGSLLHLGRRDDLVKIRGYLVEPAEVEAALLDTGLVHEAAAFGADDGQGRTSLYAYVVPIDGLRSSNAAIRRALRDRVPEYFVPTSLVAVPELPKNDNNKIDRSRLKPIPERRAHPAPPSDDWERAIAQVWCSVLGFDAIGPEDDFFSLGGDSLGVLELITAMADEHGVTVRSSDLIECPTLGAFAERARKPAAAVGGVLVPLQKSGDGPPLFCFAGGGGRAGDFLLLARYLKLDRPVYGLQARGVEGGGIPDWTTRRWAARCLRQIRAIQPHGPYHLAGHSFGGFVAWEAAQLLQRAGEEVALLVLIDTLAQSPADSVAPASGSDVPAFSPERHRRTKLLQPIRDLKQSMADIVRINASGIWPKNGPEQFELFYKHAQILFRRYNPSPWNGPTIIYTAATRLDEHEVYDFRPLLRGPWEQHDRPGNHLTIMGEPFVESLALHLRDRLAAPQAIGTKNTDA
jgi:amino acid adenylation domain-containing protein